MVMPSYDIGLLYQTEEIYHIKEMIIHGDYDHSWEVKPSHTDFTKVKDNNKKKNCTYEQSISCMNNHMVIGHE